MGEECVHMGRTRQEMCAQSGKCAQLISNTVVLVYMHCRSKYICTRFPDVFFSDFGAKQDLTYVYII